MTDCGNCQAEIGPEGPHIRVAVDGAAGVLRGCAPWS